jgi:uncharacterized OB-fold protein
MDSPGATWAAHAQRGELAYQLDADGRPVWPPSVRGTDWRVSAGRGTVYATTVVRPRDGEPYGIVLVDLDEGFRMMSTVRGVAPEDVAIGARVRVVVEDGAAVCEVGA